MTGKSQKLVAQFGIDMRRAQVAAALAGTCVAVVGILLVMRRRRATKVQASDLCATICAAGIMNQSEAMQFLSSLTLSEAIDLYSKGRPKLLAKLKSCGVQPLSRRQAVANVVGKSVGKVGMKTAAPEEGRKQLLKIAHI